MSTLKDKLKKVGSAIRNSRRKKALLALALIGAMGVQVSLGVISKAGVLNHISSSDVKEEIVLKDPNCASFFSKAITAKSNLITAKKEFTRAISTRSIIWRSKLMRMSRERERKAERLVNEILGNGKYSSAELFVYEDGSCSINKTEKTKEKIEAIDTYDSGEFKGSIVYSVAVSLDKKGNPQIKETYQAPVSITAEVKGNTLQKQSTLESKYKQTLERENTKKESNLEREMGKIIKMF